MADQNDPLFDEKYIVFKREDLLDLLERVGYEHDGDTVRKDAAKNIMERFKVEDAVVIRRQDLVAAPVLGCYSQVLGSIVKVLRKDNGIKGDFIDGIEKAGDYFDRQAAAAADEGWKLPD